MPKLINFQSIASGTSPPLQKENSLNAEASHKVVAEAFSQPSNISVNGSPADDNEDESSVRFPVRLMEMLSDEEFSDAVTWLPNGQGFIILNRKKLSREVLPKYFKKTKFASFTRKLSRWGFQRVTDGQDKGSYYHPLFQRNNLQLSSRMNCDSKAKITRISAMPKVDSGSQHVRCNSFASQLSSNAVPANMNGVINNTTALKHSLNSKIPFAPQNPLLNSLPLIRNPFLPPSSLQGALMASQTAMAVQAAKQALLIRTPPAHLLALKAHSAASRKLVHALPGPSPTNDNLVPSTQNAKAA